MCVRVCVLYVCVGVWCVMCMCCECVCMYVCVCCVCMCACVLMGMYVTSSSTRVCLWSYEVVWILAEY